ncbi:Uu.00g140420.m01.CDS01 [Anthostomella pinea]|uniref:Uu.00g140420.m01.CDS01 n=1 Tax=Anthostomella pinea TaxID=933095 RepID=A0AAI8YIZ6_9PEZI|nr:Uu.00g140420.m01.CDS01 [Anthostomella pinea]
MGEQLQVLLFGDQTFDYTAELPVLLREKDNPYLVAFVERVQVTLRRNIARLPSTERNLFPPFSSIQDLLICIKTQRRNTVLDGTLTCFYQLCSFMSFFGQHEQSYPDANDTYVAGLCIGSLAAAAVSVSRSLGELCDQGTDAVLVAMRISLRAYRMGCTISGEGLVEDGHALWSHVIPHTCLSTAAVEEELLAFIKGQCIPRPSVPYISMYNLASVTVSGPPTIVNAFVQSCVKKASKPLAIPIFSPYHAPHLFNTHDVHAVLDGLEKNSMRDSPNMRVISGHPGEVMSEDTFNDRLEAAAREILLLPLDVNAISSKLAQLGQTLGHSRCVLMPVGTNIAGSLISTLGTAGKEWFTVDSAMLKAHRSITDHASLPSSPGNSKIAIVSMSGRFPSAASTEAFWDLLHQGLDVHREVPKDRFNAKAHHDASGKRKNTSKVVHGCWIDEPGLFDPKFFNISPKEAEQSDPGQRLALQTAYEALELAGIVPDRTPSTRTERVGVFYGMTSDDWREVNSGQNVDTYFIPGGNRAFTPGRLNYFFKFSGPSVSVDTACSSSLAAIHMACNSLWRNDCDTAIAGGTNVMTNPDNFAGLDRGYFLSRTGGCKTFDDSADGYCRADGVGTVVLKRLDDAEADKDPILGIIIGAYTNHSAEAASITRPHAGAQEYIFSKLLNESGLDPKQVSYVEMHGTGTQAGDATEMASVLHTFAPDHSRSSLQSLHLGSAKANIGHGESASGVTSLIKVLMMMQKSTIPPHCGIKGQINHKFPTDLNQRNVHIAREAIQWSRPERGDNKRRAFVNNFSAAGGNSAVLLEDAPDRRPTEGLGPDPRSVHMFAVSAKSASSLRRNLKNLASFVAAEAGDDTMLPKLSYTLTARRMHHPFRFAVTARDPAQLGLAMDAAAAKDDFRRTRASPVAIGFVFSGQGSQYLGMGRHLFEHNSVFRAEVQHLDAVCCAQGFEAVSPIIGGGTDAFPGPVATQLGTACLQMALAKFWRSLGIEPSVVIGHSLGHYAAMQVAGVLSAADAIYLIGTRARLLQEACVERSHSMLAVRASLSQINPLLDPNKHDIACVNGPKEVVISAEDAEIAELSDRLKRSHMKATRLDVPYAFHSAQMNPVLDDFEKCASAVVFRPARIPIVSALLVRSIRPDDEQPFGPEYLRRHCRETVCFSGALQAAKSDGLIDDNTVWIEIGPHTHCSSFVKSTLGSETMTLPSLRRNEDGWKVLAETVGSLYSSGATLDWGEYHRDFPACQQVLPLPAYSWDNKKYWIQYVHDWTLTKGDDPGSRVTHSLPAPVSKLSTASVHRIERESVEGITVTLTAQSDLAGPQLEEVTQGHKVNGTKMCTSSLYADIGLTLGQYLLEQYRPDLQGYKVNVEHMRVDKSLILHDGGKCEFEVGVTYDVDGTKADMVIHSVAPNSSKPQTHARCTLRFQDSREWTECWEKDKYLIQRSIQWLEGRAEDRLDSRLSSGMVYKLFSSLVEYGAAYKGLQSVLLNSADYEGTAHVQLQSTEGGFAWNPLWIDSFGQLAGFMMNCHPLTAPDQVFINHGWESMRCLKPFHQGTVYQSYVRMRCVEGTTYRGDVYVLEHDVIIAVYGGITFQGIPRRVLNSIHPPPGLKPSQISRHKQSSATPPTARLSHRVEPTAPVLDERPPDDVMATGQMRPILRMLSEEIGLPLTALTDDLVFSDYGVDSLLSLTITGRIREELNMDVDSSIFTRCETLGQFKALLNLDSPHATSTPTTSSTSQIGQLTPLTSDSGKSPTRAGVDASLMSKISATLADEIGVSPSEIASSSDLAELGLDSLLSLTVLGRLREECELDLEADFFSQHTSLASIEEILCGVADGNVAGEDPDYDASLFQYAATSTLLQGSPKKAKNTLFLFPDGSGSATSYVTIDEVGAGTCLWGLSCPWLKSAEKLVQYGLKGLASLYVAEIRRRQPHGPYSLGGWSAGGICAYEAALQLTREGETVTHLILLDSPGPIGLEKLPPRLFDFLNGQGIFGEEGRRAPDWLLAHFLAFIDALDAYEPVPWSTALLGTPGEAALIPRTHLIWAEDGVCKLPGHPRPEYRDDDPREMQWLLENRTDFSPNGWDVLLGPEQIVSIERISNANHFTMLRRGSSTKRLAEFIRHVFTD